MADKEIPGYVPEIESLGTSLRRGGSALSSVPQLLRQVLEGGQWREFTTSRGDHVVYDRFEDFVTTLPLKGLGATLDLVRRLAGNDTELLDLLDQALQNPVGANQHREGGNNVTTRPDGNAKEKALRRLRKDAPELHAEVLAGHLSAHAAMVQAGFRPKTVSVPVDRPESIARVLQKNLSPESLAELRRLLDP